VYNLLIVDDEQEILDYLQSLFMEVTDPEFNVITAQSGEEAIERLNQVKVDIVLSDIMMPGINGLQLLDKIKYNWPSCKVIFLTGHRDFEYIYAATRYDDVVYLLKTVESGKIVSRVKDAAQAIENQIQQKELLEKATKQIEQVMPMIRQGTLARILRGFAEKEELSQHLFDELGVALSIRQPVYLVVGRFDDYNPAMFVSQLKEYYTLRLITMEYLPEYMHFELVTVENLYAVWIVQPVQLAEEGSLRASGANNDRVVIHGAFDLIQESCGSLLHRTISMVACATPVPFLEIERLFRDLQKRLNLKYGAGSQMFLMDPDTTAGRDGESGGFEKSRLGVNQKKNIQNIEMLIETGQKERYYSSLKAVLHLLAQNDFKYSSASQEIYLQVSVQLLSFINRYNLIDKLAVTVSLTQLVNVSEFKTGEEAANYLTRFSDAIFALQENMQRERSLDSITVIKQYVENNTDQDLSLMKLASLVSFNPAYLSRLFKQTTGENLSDYVTSEKLKKAKNLLETTDLSIKDISIKMGFYTPIYFTKFFKRLVGVSPKKYRDSVVINREVL
jgi:two-component system, response regulator YesN